MVKENKCSDFEVMFRCCLAETFEPFKLSANGKIHSENKKKVIIIGIYLYKLIFKPLEINLNMYIRKNCFGLYFQTSLLVLLLHIPPALRSQTKPSSQGHII